MCVVYPKNGYFTVLVVVGNKEKERVENQLLHLLKEIQEVYRNTKEGNGQRWLMDNGIIVQKLAPRRKGSLWSELTKERCRRMECIGRMTGVLQIVKKVPILNNLKLLLTKKDRDSFYNWCSALYNGDAPYPAKRADLLRTLWETFFLCFPVVTTTLHSFRKKVFAMVPQLFDMLLIDEGRSDCAVLCSGSTVPCEAGCLCGGCKSD